MSYSTGFLRTYGSDMSTLSTRLLTTLSVTLSTTLSATLSVTLTATPPLLGSGEGIVECGEGDADEDRHDAERERGAVDGGDAVFG